MSLSGLLSGTGTSYVPLPVVTVSVAEIVAFAVKSCPWVSASTVAVMLSVAEAPLAKLLIVQTPAAES